jgi:nuclear pore complex protein Nup54
MNFGGSTSGSSGFNFGSTSGTSTGGGSGFAFGTGSTDTSGSGGFGFGSTGGSSTTSGSGFNFGTSATGTGGGFGTTSGGSGFNFGTTSGGSGGGFGSTGGGSGSGFGLSLSGSGFGSQTQVTQENTVEGAMKKIFDFYDPSSPYCRFNFFFYNVSESGKVQEQLGTLVNKYKDQIPMSRWQEAMKHNPNTDKLVPVPARSFDDLNLRIQEQSKRITSYQKVLKYLERELESHQRDYEVKNMKTIEEIKSKQLNLNSKVLKLQMKLEVLMQR